MLTLHWSRRGSPEPSALLARPVRHVRPSNPSLSYGRPQRDRADRLVAVLGPDTGSLRAAQNHKPADGVSAHGRQQTPPAAHR